MTIFATRFIATSGQTLSAFPKQNAAGTAVSLSLWSTWRKACTESGTTGNYGVNVTDDYTSWVVVPAGASAPADLTEVICEINIVDGNSQPVTDAGELIDPIVIGDDYLAVNNRSFTWTIDAIPGVTVGTATCYFGGVYKTYSWLVTGTITVVGTQWLLSFDLLKADTEDLVPGLYRWSVEVQDASGNEITKVRNARTVELIRKQT
jgi:hypothetical protein